MEWTNQYNLSDRVIRVLKGRYKDRRPELNRLSITDLIDDPLPRILFINHWDDIVRDYSDLFTMVQGIALHSRYEDCAGNEDDTEHKFEDVVDGIIVVGKADNYIAKERTILEVKQTGVYGPKYRIPKWTKQMNCYAWQIRTRGHYIHDVEKLLVDVWYRDWKQNNIHWRDYPQIPYECLSLDLWSFEKQEKYIQSQVQKHLEHPVFDKVEQYTTPCSDKQRGIRYEAYKNKNKTPSKVGETITEMERWIEGEYTKGNTVNVIRSEPIFCQRYCRSRSVCPFAKRK